MAILTPLVTNEHSGGFPFRTRRHLESSHAQSTPEDTSSGHTDGSSPSDVSFQAGFEDLFHGEFESLHRYLARLTGDADVASDLAQEAFVKLLRRGTLPDDPRSWLTAVAMNLLRNQHTRDRRRAHLLSVAYTPEMQRSGTPPDHMGPAPAHDPERVRQVLDALPERERQLLLLRAEGFSYREMASALDLTETSVGALLSRARSAFRDALAESLDAS